MKRHVRAQCVHGEYGPHRIEDVFLSHGRWRLCRVIGTTVEPWQGVEGARVITEPIRRDGSPDPAGRITEILIARDSEVYPRPRGYWYSGTSIGHADLRSECPGGKAFTIVGDGDGTWREVPD